MTTYKTECPKCKAELHFSQQKFDTAVLQVQKDSSAALDCPQCKRTLKLRDLKFSLLEE